MDVKEQQAFFAGMMAASQAQSKPKEEKKPEAKKVSSAGGEHPMLALPVFFVLLVVAGLVLRGVDSNMARQEMLEQNSDRTVEVRP